MQFRHCWISMLCAAALVAGNSFAQEIKLGFNGDLSASPSAQSGQASVLGMQAAINDINAAGGVLGKKLTLVVRDDTSQPPRSIQNMSELIDNEKVVAVLGPTNSGNALAWKHIPNQKKVPVVTTIASGTDITKATGPDNYMFRVSMVDREQIASLVTYTVKNPNSKNIGFMAETTGYGQGGLKDLEEYAAKKGIKPVAIERFGVADTDMTSQLNKMKAAGVDTVIVWAQSTPIAQLVRSMEKINYFPLTLTSWAADNQSFLDAAGLVNSQKPLFMRTLTDVKTPGQQKIYDRIKGGMKAPSAFPFAAHGYDGVLLLAAAINQAGSTDGEKIKDALENLRAPVEGVMKTYQRPFTRTQHEALTASDLVWTKWKDGKLLPYTDEVTASLKPADINATASPGMIGSQAAAAGSANGFLPTLLQALFAGLAVGSAYALVAMGFSITFTTTKTLNFSHGDFVSGGAFIGLSSLLVLVGQPITASSFANLVPDAPMQLIALASALVVTALLGWLMYVVGIKPFSRRPGMSWVMSTLGFGIILQSIGLAVWGPKPITVPSPVGDEVIRLGSIGIRPQEILMLVVSVTVMVAFDWIMRRTMMGKKMRAVAFNQNASALMGINVNAVMVGAFLVSSALAGLSGYLLAPIAQASLFMGLAVGLKGFSGAMIGGLDNPRGCVIGGFVLGVLESLINLWQAQWREIAVFALVILVLAFRPNGLFGYRTVEKV